MARDVLLATRNEHKVEEIRRLLAGLELRILSPTDLGLEATDGEEAIEIWDTFSANALAKAAWFRGLTGLPTLADDSGLCVDALDGAPGVFSRRFAPPGAFPGRDQDEANNLSLLDRLSGVATGQRGAHYRAALALVDERRQVVVFGRCDGAIAEQPRGSGGFGYDPLFLVPGTGRTFGELDPSVKSERSHRAAAVHALRPWLQAPPARVHAEHTRSSSD